MESRVVFELLGFSMHSLKWPSLPKGDKHPVLVIPGFAGSDSSTWALRRFLDYLDYQSHPWNLGVNLGPNDGIDVKLQLRLREIFTNSHRKVSIIGWSLGGIYARVLANRHPNWIRQVITLGSPISGNLRANNVSELYEWVTGGNVDELMHVLREDLSQKPKMPITSIYSKSDGVVHWESCIHDDHNYVQNVEVNSTHVGMGHNPQVMNVVADRLQFAKHNWQPFKKP